jgi:hypothetical protein
MMEMTETSAMAVTMRVIGHHTTNVDVTECDGGEPLHTANGIKRLAIVIHYADVVSAKVEQVAPKAQ